MVNKYRVRKTRPPYKLFISLDTFFEFFDYLGAESKYLMSERRDWEDTRDLPGYSLFHLCRYP